MQKFVIFTLLASATASNRQSFLREPFDQIATVGEHVTLPCRVSHREGVLQWTREDFGLGSDRGLEGFRRYAMTGSDEEGKKCIHTYLCCYTAKKDICGPFHSLNNFV
jgi:hypothetical protein